MRHDSASVIGANNCVGLPVSDAAFCGDNGRSLIDVDAVRNQPAPRILAFPLVVFFAAVTQVKMQCATVFLVFPDMLIDALVTDKADAILRQTAADLIGTPLLSRQFFLDQLHQVRRHFAWLVRGLLPSLRGLLVRLLEAIAARPGVANKLAADRRRIHANLPRNVGLRVAALQERINLAALFAGQMEIAFGHCPSVRFAVPRKDSPPSDRQKTRIYSTAKSGRRNGQPQGCSLRSHRLRRLKPLTPTLSPAVHSAMPSMLHCCTSDLNRRRQINCHAARGLDRFRHAGDLVGWKVVHDDDVTTVERRGQTSFDIGEKYPSVHRPINHEGSYDCVMAQAGYQRDRLAMPMRNGADQPFTTGATAPQPHHLGAGGGFVDEYQPGRVKHELFSPPASARAGYVRPLLLRGVKGFF